MTRTSSMAIIAAAALSAAPIFAQTTQQPISDADVIAMSEWSYDDLYANGISAEDFIDEMEVYDVSGEEIGDVEDILIGPDGQVVAIIAEVGGFWDIGDTHVSVPFGDVEMAADGDGVIVPVTEDTVGDYGFWDNEAVPTGAVETEVVEGVDDAYIPRAWRASELIGDTARLQQDDEGYANYGYINDLILRNGQVAAVVVQPGAGYGVGYRAYPYRGYGMGGWSAGSPYYDMPYRQGDVGEMEAFEYDRLED